MPRGSHTIRIFGTNKNDDVLHDIWLDIERIDLYVTHEQINGFDQTVMNRLYWMDDPNDPEYDEDGGGGNFARTRGTLKIGSPDEADPEDPEQWVPVAINISINWNDQQRTVSQGNRNSADNDVRVVAARRIWHRDTVIDSDVAAATAANSDLRAYVVASDKYDFVDATDDKDNFLEVQYVSRTIEMLSEDTDAGLGTDQAVLSFLRNAFYLNISEEAKGPVNHDHGFDPPWALDPFQAIVNCQWKVFGAIAVLASGQPTQITCYKKTKKNEAGDFQSLGFLNFTENGSVRGCSYAKVTSGTPPKAEPIFLLCGDDGNDVLGGAVNGIIMVSNDGLHWTATATHSGVRFQRMTWNPDDEAFFAEAQSWIGSDHTTRTCWTSTDGRTWKAGGGDFASHLKYGAEDGQYGFDPGKGKDGHLVKATDLNVANLTFAGGVWFRSGGAEGESYDGTDLLESVDDTTTWQQIKNFGPRAADNIFPLIAGAWQDVKAWQAAHRSGHKT